MTFVAKPWDYLIMTAANRDQASAYESQLELRRQLGLLSGVREILVLPDPEGQRIGSGGATLCCLMEVLRRELASRGVDPGRPELWRSALERLRILIVHAGGDSRRLPAYGTCGKIFVPVPGDGDSAAAVTLFDRQIHTYLALPPAPDGTGQVVITAGDVLLSFDPTLVQTGAGGITGLGCRASSEEASHHGVYCADGSGEEVRLFLQKPSCEEQAAKGAVDRYGQAILDIGVMMFDARTAAALLEACGVHGEGDGTLSWAGDMGSAIEAHGLDFYREICCALGTEASPKHHRVSVGASGSSWDERPLEQLFQALRGIPFGVRVLPQCAFLHFGTTHQIIHSGLELLRTDQGVSKLSSCLQIGSLLGEQSRVMGSNAWIEACRIDTDLQLGGHNVVSGVDLDEPTSLPTGACLSVIQGRDRVGERAWFVLCYGANDLFKDTIEQSARFCNRPVASWLSAAGLGPDEVWDRDIPPDRRTLWDARLFPVVLDPGDHHGYLWMFSPEDASTEQKTGYRRADRLSLAEIACLADREAFYERRSSLRAEEIRESLRRMFRPDSGFSSKDLGRSLANLLPADRTRWVDDLLGEAHWHYEGLDTSAHQACFVFSRMIHTLGSALSAMAEQSELDEILPGLRESMAPARSAWLEQIGLGMPECSGVAEWSARARAVAVAEVGQSILTSGSRLPEPPSSALRSDEIVWGRAPARLDLGGGWTDTPPYSLEQGGCVINAAVYLNGQPPIHAYARLIREPVLRIASIDLGTRIEIATLDDLLDFRSATSEFSLAKAALALSGFSPEAVEWPAGTTLQGMLETFGGGIELTTLAAIPKGSGLGTSSIVGAVILAVLQRVLGRQLTQQELFHGVLRLEQALTTGGGWQDQIGGAVSGVKVATTDPGLVPDARIHYLPADVLDPRANGERTLLYYTGITRLAKNILQDVVGRYLDRDRAAMATLRQIHGLPLHVAEAMARKDLPSFGALIDAAWQLNKQLDPNSSNPEVEALLARVRPHVYGAKLLGAGGGGFLLLVCRSAADAAAVRETLTSQPPNPRARFFDFDVSREGLVVTVA